MVEGIVGIINATPEHESDDDSVLATAEDVKPLYKDILSGERSMNHLRAVAKLFFRSRKRGPVYNTRTSRK
jgi:hypothetical protein